MSCKFYFELKEGCSSWDEEAGLKLMPKDIENICSGDVGLVLTRLVVWEKGL